MSLNRTSSPSETLREISIGELSSLDLETFSGSSQLLKKTLPLAVSTIVSRRIAINPAYLRHHSVANVPYVAFGSTLPSNHCARNLMAAQEKIQLMIEKKCLHSIHLYIQTRATKKIEETFEFRLSYDDDPSARLPFDAEAHQVAGDFFDKFNRFPNDAKHDENDISILCEFAFYSCISQEDLNMFPPNQVPDKPKTITTSRATMRTPYITFEVRMNTRREPAPRSSLASGSSKRSRDENSFILPASKISKNSSGEKMEYMNWEEYECGCTIPVKIAGVESIRCYKCKRLQHVACVGYTLKKNIPDLEKHLCHKCCIRGNKVNRTFYYILLKSRRALAQYHQLVCVARLFLVCKKTKPHNFALNYLAPDDSKDFEAYLKKKKLWDASIEKAKTYFYDM